MRKYRTDYSLWAIIAGGLFVLLGAAVVAGRDWTPEARSRLPADAVNVAFWSLVFGWVIHAVAVMCGIRATKPADPGPVADYDDKPPPS